MERKTERKKNRKTNGKHVDFAWLHISWFFQFYSFTHSFSLALIHTHTLTSNKHTHVHTLCSYKICCRFLFCCYFRCLSFEPKGLSIANSTNRIVFVGLVLFFCFSISTGIKQNKKKLLSKVVSQLPFYSLVFKCARYHSVQTEYRSWRQNISFSRLLFIVSFFLSRSLLPDT